VSEGKAKRLSRRSIVLLSVRNPVVRKNRPEVFDCRETEQKFIQKFRSLLRSDLSDKDALAAVQHPEHFGELGKRESLIRLSQHYWNETLCNLGSSVNRGIFMPDAPRGCGRLVTGEYDSKKLEFVDAHRRMDGTRRVKAANFVAGSFNGGIIASVGHGPDDFISESPDSCKDQKAEWNVMVTLIAMTNSFLQNQRLSQEEIVSEMQRIFDPTFNKKNVTLVCACGVRENRELRLPEGVQADAEMPFTCKTCNGPYPNNARSRMRRKNAVASTTGRAGKNPTELKEVEVESNYDLAAD
jgi:hypothetical protein